MGTDEERRLSLQSVFHPCPSVAQPLFGTLSQGVASKYPCRAHRWRLAEGVDLPPPLPRARLSPFLLVSLLFTIVAVAITAILCTNEDWVPVPWQRLGLAVTGNFAATMSLIFGAVVLFDRRKGWPVTIFIGVVSVGVFWFLVPQLRQPVRDIVGQVRLSTKDGMREARQAIPQKKGAVTAAKIEPSLVAWGEETMVRPYDEHGHHDAKMGRQGRAN